MNAQAQFPRFNALAAYEAERDENRRLFELLGNVLMVADHMASLLERQGYDLGAKRAILDNARKARFEDLAA